MYDVTVDIVQSGNDVEGVNREITGKSYYKNERAITKITVETT